MLTRFGLFDLNDATTWDDLRELNHMQNQILDDHFTAYAIANPTIDLSGIQRCFTWKGQSELYCRDWKRKAEILYKRQHRRFNRFSNHHRH